MLKCIDKQLKFHYLKIALVALWLANSSDYNIAEEIFYTYGNKGKGWNKATIPLGRIPAGFNVSTFNKSNSTILLFFAFCN